MQLNDQVSLETANLSAHIPIRSSDDFTLSFRLVVPELTDIKQRQEIADLLVKSIPFLQVSTYGDDNRNISCSLSDTDKAGICKHTLKMFQDSGVEVTAMGQRFQQPPYLENSPVLQDLPYSLKNFKSFKELVEGVVNNVLSGVKIFDVSRDIAL